MRVLILHGWQGSGPDHWQTWLARRLRDAGADVRYPQLPDADAPEPAVWDGVVAAEIAALGVAGERVVVCHSLGCVAWLRRVRRADAPVDRVLLVAPPSPATDIAEVARFFPVALDAGAVAAAAGETRLVCARDDPYCPEGADAVYGAALRIPVDLVPRGGHLNPDAGYGPWPAVEAWVHGEAARVAA